MKKNKRSNLNEDLSHLKDAISLTATDFRGKASDAFNDSLHHMRKKISKSYNNARDKSLDVKDDVSSYIGERPFKALGIAVLSGIVLGYSMRKQKRKPIIRS